MFSVSNYSFIFGILILGLIATTPSFAMHQTTHIPYILTTGNGDGKLTVGVDGYGAFGNNVGDAGTNAMFDPLDSPVGGTAVHSGIAIRSVQNNNLVTTFLASGDIFGTGNLLPNPQVSGTPTIGTSSFSHLGLDFVLIQTVTLTASGTTLTQIYTITNPSGSPTLDFSLFRYFDGDLFFVNNFVNDGGGKLDLDGTEILFETDEPGTSSEDNTFVGITAEGGMNAPDRFEINSFPDLAQGIVDSVDNLNNEILLDNMVTGDGNLDDFIDGGGYDVSLALRNDFSLAGGESAVYVTKTVFGSGPPADVEIVPPIQKQLIGGIILPLDPISLLIAGSQSITWVIPISISILGIGLVLVKRKIH